MCSVSSYFEFKHERSIEIMSDKFQILAICAIKNAAEGYKMKLKINDE
jgi:hypothetical protein